MAMVEDKTRKWKEIEFCDQALLSELAVNFMKIWFNYM